MFADGSYKRLATEGEEAGCVCAYLRRLDEAVLVVPFEPFPFRGEAALRSASLVAPELDDDRYDLLTGRRITGKGGAFAASALFAALTVALLAPAEMLSARP
jgi:maltooligosyltrehalose synthase